MIAICMTFFLLAFISYAASQFYINDVKWSLLLFKMFLGTLFFAFASLFIANLK